MLPENDNEVAAAARQSWARTQSNNVLANRGWWRHQPAPQKQCWTQAGPKSPTRLGLCSPGLEASGYTSPPPGQDRPSGQCGENIWSLSHSQLRWGLASGKGQSGGVGIPSNTGGWPMVTGRGEREMDGWKGWATPRKDRKRRAQCGVGGLQGKTAFERKAPRTGQGGKVVAQEKHYRRWWGESQVMQSPPLLF